MIRFKYANPVRESFRVAGDTGSPRRAAGRRHAVEVVTVDPRVWRAALELANGDALRIEVVNAEDVIIHNNREWRQ